MSTQSKVFNDPIHGSVELHPLLVKIIDTPQFQRLRYIRQLGGAYFVYPGASHNRFEHSIGVAHLAGKLAKALNRRRHLELNITERDILCVQIAGLCHDLGHGPFSHLFDQKFIAKKRPDQNWKHEKASVEMFKHMVEKNKLEEVMKKYGLELPQDIKFITEMILPEEKTEPWPYEGRPEEKSFLYEIVANKRNGIDVDKFDYLARDCYHLGIQSNFDHHRFLKFARVCEVDGQKLICTRDKEVANMYDLFYTRYCLHRRACQHKTHTVIEIMIAEAFSEADSYIRFKGEGNEEFPLSETIDDMEAYTKVTDRVFEQILHDPRPEMSHPREILEAIISRKHYKLLGEIRPQGNIEWGNDRIITISQWKGELAAATCEDGNCELCSIRLTAENFEIADNTMDYGDAEVDPISNMYFYSKETDEAFRISREQVSRLLPNTFSEQLIRVYIKNTAAAAAAAAATEAKILRAGRKRLVRWCENKGWPRPQLGCMPVQYQE